MLAATGQVDAVICANDLIALGVLDAFAEHGNHGTRARTGKRPAHGRNRTSGQPRLRVPEDVAVTGFDDIAFATLIRPTLTSVRQPVDELGAEAVRALLSRLSRTDGRPRKIRIQPDLVVRQSTAR